MTANKLTMQAFSDDKLGRKELAQHFKNVLLNTDLNVFSLVAPWGCGKTYFIQNLIKTMEEDSVNILYNAWESDFYDSPLIPLLSELFVKLETLEKKDELKRDINWSKKFAKKLCKGTTIQAGFNLKWFNCGLNFDPDKSMINSEYIELKSEICEFKSKLKSIQETIDKKVIIFIDELDRCNPMYTIKTLEVIKHFFGIPNIVFVLAIDKSQIENSVRTIFGMNQGSENGYLRKFIDVEFELPKYSSKEFIAIHLMNIWSKIEYFIQKNKYYNYHRRKDSTTEAIWLTDFIFLVTNMFSFSLRDLEKFFIRFELLLDTLSQQDVLLIEPCIILNVLAMYEKADFDNYIISNIKEGSQLVDINKSIVPHWKNLMNNSYIEAIRNGMSQGSIRSNTVESNAIQLEGFLSNNINAITVEQEKYLQDYPLKIKFIHNFNVLD